MEGGLADLHGQQPQLRGDQVSDSNADIMI